MNDLPLADIQGFIMRTYAMPALRVFVLRVNRREAAGRLLASLADRSHPIAIATAATWQAKPEFCVNIGITHAGLRALGLPAASLDSFPVEYIEGAVGRAPRIGDTGASDPAHWKGGLAGDAVHALTFLFAQSDPALEQATTALRDRFHGDGAFAEISVQDGRALPGNVAHFGYRDGFAQPTIDGGLPPLVPDVLPKAPAGEFLLGYPSQYTDFTYPVPAPSDRLGANGSFVAYRVLEQDCAGFEAFLARAAGESGLDPELIAAKLCGRWRNGVPLALSPDTANVDLPPERYNSFDYVPTDAVPDAVDDRRGSRCPIGAHIRRMNPRHSTVAGNSGLKRRLIRRGLPYGPPYDPAAPNDGIERGLLGLFVGVSLKDQFEFLMSDWANKGSFAPGLRETRDAIIGDNAAAASTFLVPRDGQPTIVLSGLARFVTCRGGAYAFLPSMTALRYLGQVAAGVD
jgi:deferrochelatase/peroxidase EfeB